MEDEYLDWFEKQIMGDEDPGVVGCARSAWDHQAIEIDKLKELNRQLNHDLGEAQGAYEYAASNLNSIEGEVLSLRDTNSKLEFEVEALKRDLAEIKEARGY